MLKNVFLLSFALAVLFFVTSLSADADENTCGPFLQTHCGECHEVKRVCDLYGITREEWQEVFKAMKEMGADIPEAELKMLSECLVDQGDAFKKLCK